MGNYGAIEAIIVQLLGNYLAYFWRFWLIYWLICGMQEYTLKYTAGVNKVNL